MSLVVVSSAARFYRAAHYHAPFKRRSHCFSPGPVNADGLSSAMPYIGFSSLRDDNSCRPPEMCPDASDSGSQSLAMPDDASLARMPRVFDVLSRFRVHSVVCYGYVLFDIYRRPSARYARLYNNGDDS